LSIFSPVPKVTWKKLNGILPPIPRWSTDPKTYDTEAIIKNLVPEDAGEYICTGTNSVGSANTTIKLIIEGESWDVSYNIYYYYLLLLLLLNCHL